MKVLIKLSNDWPEHVSGNPVLDKWVHKIPWSGIECFLLCEDGNVYQSYIKCLFCRDKRISTFQAYTHR
ncbi:hypothetical protein BANRA_03578 [Klebsiella pneumoniae]|nr:hypothetical protein BANRA_03578 [Klebsiella pneumoniae]